MPATEKHKAKKVLLVDDDIDLLMLLERKLQQAGYYVESAASLPEAQYVVSLFKPDVVLLDINVSGEDGRQLCWKVKNAEQSQKTKVILMSGYNYTINRQLLFGADDYCAKPFTSELLLQKISSALEEEGATPPLHLKVIVPDQLQGINHQAPF